MISLNDEVKLLRQIPYFGRIDACKLKLLAFTSSRACYEGGQIVFHQGDASDAAYVVLRGTAEIVAMAPGGETSLGEATAGTMIGELCLVSDAPRLSTVRALTALELLRIPRDSFLRLVADNPRMSAEVSRALAEAIRDKAASLARQLARVPQRLS